MDSEYVLHVPLVLDDDSEPSEEEPPDPRRELEHFRQQWQEELKRHTAMLSSQRESKLARKPVSNDEKEEQAKLFFLQGVKAEQCGALYEAIQFYRRAMQLVPDIESKIDFDLTRGPRVRQESENSISSLDFELEDEDLLQRFSKFQNDEQEICSTVTKQNSMHISALPVELLNYIFKWVVSSELDMKSLENISEVCRGFYLCARDDELWRLACLRVWGVNCGKRKQYGTWRNMFIERPHLHYNGCYISRTSYVRQGEKSLDNFYRPWHIVEYYRYVRFFPDGVMLMMTSPEDPLTTVSKLKSKQCYIQGLLRGYYRLSGDQVTGVLKRVKTFDYQRYKRRNQENDQEQTFHLEFTVRNNGKRSYMKLIWERYLVKTKYR
ncbi:hypothetical protein ScPMuIL_007597 [Solemya velum]